MERQITIGYGEERITASLHYPAEISSKERRCKSRVPVVLICHGFVGSRTGVDRLFVESARQLAAAGYLTVRFDYLGCGESSGSYGREGMDSMVKQTRAVLDYVLGCCDADPTQVTLIGHSLGGAVAVLAAASDRRIKHLVLWSAVGYPLRDIVQITGQQVYDNSVKFGHEDYLGYEFTPVFFESLAESQPLLAAGKFSGNVLVLHGTSDEVIPADYASLFQKEFWERPEGSCERKLIFQAGHTYSNGAHRTQLISETVEWLSNQEAQQTQWQHWMI